jgi:predicted AlkP superfamily phosphohydrolase/phosphomutase
MFTRPEDRDYGERVMEDLYVRMDGLLGRTMDRLGDRDVMMVISDHGFTEFNRGVNLNTWLRERGYLAVKEGGEDEQYLQGVDWSKTRAYTFGLAGIYLNVKGREREGIVDRDEVSALKAEIASALRTLKDPAKDRKVVKGIHDASDVYRGPYVDHAPDLVVGLQDGYRASWDAAVGRVSKEIFSDNLKKWRGDHCVDQSLVPGVFVCNRKVRDLGNIRLMDIAPTVLKTLGIPVPSYMDGRAKDIALSES